MKSKKSTGSFTVLLLISALVINSCGGTDSKTADEAEMSAAAAEVRDTNVSEGIVQSPEVIAYYFHTTQRCVSCRKIEAYSKEAIEKGFAAELADGTLEFLPINLDEPANAHFEDDYQLYTKSLVICRFENGTQVEWKNLAKVWQLIQDKDEFVEYVRDEISAYLREN